MDDILLSKVYKYIKTLPLDLGFPNKIDIVYNEHCDNLNILEFDLRDALIELQSRKLIILDKYTEGAIITFLRK